MISHQPALRLASFSDGLGRGFDLEDSPTPITSVVDPLVQRLVHDSAPARTQPARNDKSLETGLERAEPEVLTCQTCRGAVYGRAAVSP